MSGSVARATDMAGAPCMQPDACSHVSPPETRVEASKGQWLAYHLPMMGCQAWAGPMWLWVGGQLHPWQLLSVLGSHDLPHAHPDHQALLPGGNTFSGGPCDRYAWLLGEHLGMPPRFRAPGAHKDFPNRSHLSDALGVGTAGRGPVCLGTCWFTSLVCGVLHDPQCTVGRK